jgi:formylmethanofuran dehydrogenase subunit B
MGDAWIDGSAVTLEAAALQAANLLRKSRLPVIAGLGTDVAGVRAAVTLAARIGGVIDHMHSQALLRDLACAREAGVMLTTITDAGLRADTLLMVGPGLHDAWPEIGPRLIARSPGKEVAEGFRRRVFWLCPGPNERDASHALQAPVITATVGTDPKQLKVILAALRARTAGRPCAKLGTADKAVEQLAAELRSARYGVAVWAPGAIDALAVEMLCGLVDDFNRSIRFSGLPLPIPDHAEGALQVLTWMTGFPMRTGFGRGVAEHDEWRFDAKRLVESGEADCAIWISAFRPAAPDWSREIPTIALTASGTHFRYRPHIHVAVGRPGLDHDAVEQIPETGTLAAIAAARPGAAVSVAVAIGHIASALASHGAASC